MAMIGRKAIYTHERGPNEEESIHAREEMNDLTNAISGGVRDYRFIIRKAGEAYKNDPSVFEEGVRRIYNKHMIEPSTVEGEDVYNAILSVVDKRDIKTRDKLKKIRSGEHEKEESPLGHLVTTSVFASIGAALLLIFGSKMAVTSSAIKEVQNVDLTVSFIGAVILMAAVWFFFKAYRTKNK